MSAKTVLAIDPGSVKCGMAAVHRDDASNLILLWRAVAKREELLDELRNVAAQHPFSLVIIGSGTKSREVVHLVREEMPSMAILVVDERDTSLQARERYWEHHPRRGFRRLLPATLQVPPQPVDDFVALILAERVLLQG